MQMVIAVKQDCATGVCRGIGIMTMAMSRHERHAQVGTSDDDQRKAAIRL